MGRFYTAARRHPWVLGKVADFKIPLGPYTPAQIAVAAVGGLLLVETVTWWTWMGPLPLVVWVVAIWVVRRPKFAGRAPLPAAVGWLTLLMQPAAGRIGGRVARDRAPHPVRGGFIIEGLGDLEAVPVSRRRRAGDPPARSQRAVRRSQTRVKPAGRRPRSAAHRPESARPPVASPAQRLMAQAAARHTNQAKGGLS
ncbi:hypothetical protein [Streptomyces mauvecolor]|uniref:hypothetical protein n=1 Tax=Streptomyces mauvecolor TaxID=58345 RepID=UPI0036D2EDD2